MKKSTIGKAILGICLMFSCVVVFFAACTPKNTDQQSDGKDKPPSISEARAQGGDISFVKNTDNPKGWDEVHIFYYGSQYGGVHTARENNVYDFTFDTELENVEMLLVAGGGGGGAGKNNDFRAAGGGGAGGVAHVEGITLANTDSPLSITVGAGGKSPALATASTQAANNGKNTSLRVGSDTLTVKGGGGGGGHGASWDPGPVSGGSCGGPAGASGSPATTATGIASLLGQMVSYYGNKGSAGGGGGAGGIGGANASADRGGDGGIGVEFSTSGEMQYYGGGGGAGAPNGLPENAGQGGLGGGGAWAEHGEAGTGGGGGGGGGSNAKVPLPTELNPTPVANQGGDGGSGIVIIRFSW